VDVGSGAKMVLMMAALVVVGAGIKLAAPLLVPLLLATFLAIITAPMVLWLRKHHIPSFIAVIAALLVNGAVLGLIGVAVSQSITGLSLRLPEYQELFTAWFEHATEWLTRYGLASDRLVELVSPGDVMGTAANLFKSVANILSNLVLVLVVVVFMLFEVLGLEAKLMRIVPDRRRLVHLARGTRRVNRYLAVKTLTSAATGGLCGLICYAVELDFPILWGILAFLLNFVPTIGSIIAAIPPTLLALVLIGPAAALLTAGGYLAVNFTIGNFLEPRILGRTLGLSPLVVFLSMVLWSWLLGPVGALLAVPLTMVVRIAVGDTEDLRWISVLLGPAGEARRKREAST
jgi:predicted PurR-regulated permease PerM